MRIHRWFLILWIVFLFSLGVVSPSSAKEELPAIVKKIESSVVVILTYDKEGKVIGQGSGFFISENGDVITNIHILEGATSAEVKTVDGKVYPIKHVVAEDKEGDLIRVSVDIPQDAVHPLSVSASLPEVGERIAVIGSPLGLERTVSDGIVSAVREIPGFGNIVQITAPISHGSSGSPVVNMKGEVIGVATFLLLEGQNLNFAIPGERITRLVPGKGKTLAEWERMEWIDKFLSRPRPEVEARPSPNRKKEDYEKDIQRLQEAIRINPDDAGAHCGLGWAYNKLGRYQEAVEACKQAIRIKPDYAEAQGCLGEAYYLLGRWNEAIEAYKQAIRIKPDVAEAHNILGLAYGNLGRHHEAMEAFKQAIRIKPDLAWAHYSLGEAYGNLGRWNEAIESFKQAVRIEPDYAEAHGNLGVAYGNLGRYNEAIEAFKQAIRIKPDLAKSHFNLGVAYGKLGRHQEAIEASKQAIRIKPDYADAHYNLGVAYLGIGDKGSAIDEYKILKDLNKNLANELFKLIYK